jgi:2,4-dienoyl-CoA reductase-like NADH-dependent reductase (Old Yellow Enzyme family)
LVVFSLIANQEESLSQIFTPYKMDALNLANRTVIAPMCQYSAQDGQAQDWHLIHYGQLALSGAGLLIIEATAVEPEGRISSCDLGLWDEASEKALGRVLTAVRRYSTMPLVIQLAHAGRKASTAKPWDGGTPVTPEQGGWVPLAPSCVPYDGDSTPPKELDTTGMQRILTAFVESAKRAARLGLDGVELHCAHGYLLHEFLSPLTNTREDVYGGSLENRMRFPLEVFDAMRAVLPKAMPLGVRISASDWVEGGWDVEQSVQFTHELKKRGSAYIHVSSGGLTPNQKITLGGGYQVPFAERIRKETGLTTIAVGLITEPKQAEEIIASGQADLVALGRAMLYDPHWPWHAAAELGAQVDAPPQYMRSQPRQYKSLLRQMNVGGKK